MKKLLGIIILLIIGLMILSIYKKQKKASQHSSLQLVFALDIIRHGDRSPMHDLPIFSEFWQNQEKGILTKKGEDESFKLGEYIRNEYINQHHLLPEQFSNEMIVVKSSNKQRTIKTAEQIIKGMYQTLPDVNVELFDEENNPLHPKELSLSIVSTYLRQNASQELLNRIKETIHNINKNITTNFTEEDIGKISDVITVNESHDIKKPKNLPETYYEQAHSLGVLARIQAISSRDVSCKAGSLLLANILHLLENYSVTHLPKYILYTTHDAIIMGLLNLLDEPNIDPPYLARIQIGVFQDSLNKLYIKLSYNSKTLTPCGVEYCPLQKFTDDIKKRLQLCS